MPVVTIDVESYYSTTYSLKRISEVDYILDPQFQIIMCAIKLDNGPSEVFIGRDAVAAKLATIDWPNTALCSHNIRFDGAIAAWHFGINPALYLDTLSMARALTAARARGNSLAAVSKYLGLPDKGTQVESARGVRLEDMSPEFLRDYAAYCARDNDNCREIFNLFMRAFPKPELRLVDAVARMFIEPQVKLDTEVLCEHLNTVRAEKAAVMAKVAHIDKSVFASSQKFGALLQTYGVQPPTKISPATGETIWALAKNDRDFKELCEDDTQPLEVQAVLAARINSKSTLEETRTERLLNLSLREWSGGDTGWAPVPLKYSGAHTHRLSGDGSFNWQNFRRGSRIRAAIVAPPGMRIVHRDASQIEVRMLAYLARCERLLTAFAENRDIYSEFASHIYRRTITKADKVARFCGKTCILGLGYQAGGPKLRHALFIGQGGISLKVDDEEAQQYVWAYRDAFPEVPALWKLGEEAISQMLELGQPYAAGNLQVSRRWNSQPYPVVQVDNDAVWLPNGLCIAYPDLRIDQVLDPVGQRRTERTYKDSRGNRAKIYGGKFTENCDQALSRIVVMDIVDRVYRQTGLRPFLTTHDSLDYCVPETSAPEIDELLAHEFTIRPSWAPRIPLASEGGYGPCLLAAEDEHHPDHNQ